MTSATLVPERPRILIVDDDGVMCTLARESLAAFGFESLETGTGEQALDFLDGNRVDLVLLDVDMPGIDGFETCRRMRAGHDAVTLPVIMVTGMDDLDSVTQAFEAGANDFIAKPIHWPMLGHRVRYVMRNAQAASRLRSLEEKQAATVRAIPDMIFLCAADGTMVDFKPGYQMPAFAAPEDFLGRRVAEILPEPAASAIEAAQQGALRSGALQTVQYWLPLADKRHDYEARIVRSGADHTLAVVRDITVQKANEEKIQRLAYFDTLTGMPNRRHFMEQLSAQIEQARQRGDQLALLFLDLDGFKRVNDTLGHSVGDFLLQAVARRLKERLRPEDTVARALPGEAPAHLARLGGDEFTIVLPNLADPGDAQAVAARICGLIAQPYTIGDEQINVTASIGIAVYPAHGEDAATLLKFADTAMYHAKEAGRNNSQMYHSRFTNEAVARMRIEAELRTALERGEFRLHYQPQVLARDLTLTGFESLIRWQHPVRGLESPQHIIGPAEASGLIVPIGLWVIEETCRQLRAWMDAGLGSPRMALNLSVLQLADEGFADAVAGVLARSRIAGTQLEFELTESLFMDAKPGSLDNLMRLRAMGVSFALDDFGTGYSSLAYLKRFPVGTLKIDQGFVRGLPDSADDAGITTAIIAMGRSLGLDVVAEGVETPAQRRFLVEAGCERMQGYLFSRPLTAAAAADLLAQAPALHETGHGVPTLHRGSLTGATSPIRH